MTEKVEGTDKNILYSYLPLLTIYGPFFFFRRISRHNLKLALFVYRLIGATLIGFFYCLFKKELKFR